MFEGVREFHLPGVVYFGWGAVEKLGTEAHRFGTKALLVTGRGATKGETILGRVSKLLAEAGVEAKRYSEVESDPSPETVDQGVALARSWGAQMVIGLGGGSPMDAARAIAALHNLEGSILDYVRGRQIDRPGLPLLQVATTSGTASEITPIAVILDRERKVKMGIRCPYGFAQVAITDPELTMTMPPSVTASSGVDALTHAVESYISKGASPPSEGLSLEAIRLIGAYLRRAVNDGTDREARWGMALASMTAGMAFANAGLGAVHGLVHPVGAGFGVAHGAGCGLLLPHVLRFNLPAVSEKLRQVALALEPETQEAKPDDAIYAVERLLKDIGLPLRLRDLGIEQAALPEIAPLGLLAGAVKMNPVTLNEQTALRILEEAW